MKHCSDEEIRDGVAVARALATFRGKYGATALAQTITHEENFALMSRAEARRALRRHGETAPAAA